MSLQQKVVYTLYCSLLTLYPRPFRERFGASMAQTFADLCRERQWEGEVRRAGFILWIFIETTHGVVDEHITQFKGGICMKTNIMDLRAAAVISFLMMLPFALLELLWNETTRRNLSNFPVILFGLLWLLPMIFFIILLPTVRDVRVGKDVMARQISLLGQVAFLALIAFLWVALLQDQWPCFLGIPNCD